MRYASLKLKSDIDRAGKLKLRRGAEWFVETDLTSVFKDLPNSTRQVHRIILGHVGIKKLNHAKEMIF